MILSPDDATLYYRLMWRLQFYVKQRQQLLPDIDSFETYSAAIDNYHFIVRNALWKNPELIGSYVKENPDDFSPEELNIISKWKGFIEGKFYIFRYLKNYTIFIGDTQIYQVLGLTESLDDIFYGRPLPIYVQAVLLPFKGKIIYDGHCQYYNVFFGGGVRSGLNERYMTAKQNRLIIATLEETVPSVAPPAPKSRKLDEESENMVDDIINFSEQLRGGTVIQSATFALLRASAKVVEAALSDPDGSEDLNQLSRKAQSALKRLQTKLERAKYSY